MLKKHYLAGDCIYVCTEHDDAIIDGYIDALDPIFKLTRDCEDGRDVGRFSTDRSVILVLIA